MKKKSILDIQISCFASYLATESKNINLLTWLSSKKYCSEVEKIRATKDENLKKNLKSKLPAITPSGLFSKRNSKSLITHSGFMQIDIDFKDNTHIKNYGDLKQQISNIKEVAYCGLSVSGNGYWGLIPISEPTKHKQHFEALLLKFKYLGINIDKNCKDVARLRGYSYDNDAYFNHSAEKFNQVLKEEKKKPFSYNHFVTNHSESTKNKVEKCINLIQSKRIDITASYDNWFSIGCSIANEFGETGRVYFHIISRINEKYSEKETDKQYSHCLKNTYNYSIATLYYYCKLNNIHI
ncbi:BT4734/BF3469 family protein [Polaribacter sp. R77954]|uniref:BT4734/BF3469 family protein n=1 Tax=Polaribacter sp. R77954 TaxID=3093870 RepID=UPI0037CCB2A6